MPSNADISPKTEPGSEVDASGTSPLETSDFALRLRRRAFPVVLSSGDAIVSPAAKSRLGSVLRISRSWAIGAEEWRDHLSHRKPWETFGEAVAPGVPPRRRNSTRKHLCGFQVPLSGEIASKHCPAAVSAMAVLLSGRAASTATHEFSGMSSPVFGNVASVIEQLRGSPVAHKLRARPTSGTRLITSLTRLKRSSWLRTHISNGVVVVPFFLISTHMQILMVGPMMHETVNQPADSREKQR